MNFKFIQKGESFLVMHPDIITDRIANQDLIQVQDKRGKVLYETMEYPDDEETRILLYKKYSLI